MNTDQNEPTEAEVKAAKSKQTAIQADVFRKSLRFMSNAELNQELAKAESNGDARAQKSIKATLEAKEVTDRVKIIATARRCLEACVRSGTPEQVAQERARLESYENGGPLPDSL